MVRGRVDPRLEARCARPLVEPGAGLEMGVGEGRAIDAPVGRGADPGERVEVGAQPVGVDMEHHRARCYSGARRPEWHGSLPRKVGTMS